LFKELDADGRDLIYLADFLKLHRKYIALHKINEEFQSKMNKLESLEKSS
jgi:hypothetical protein